MPRFAALLAIVLMLAVSAIAMRAHAFAVGMPGAVMMEGMPDEAHAGCKTTKDCADAAICLVQCLLFQALAQSDTGLSLARREMPLHARSPDVRWSGRSPSVQERPPQIRLL